MRGFHTGCLSSGFLKNVWSLIISNQILAQNGQAKREIFFQWVGRNQAVRKPHPQEEYPDWGSKKAVESSWKWQ